MRQGELFARADAAAAAASAAAPTSREGETAGASALVAVASTSAPFSCLAPGAGVHSTKGGGAGSVRKVVVRLCVSRSAHGDVDGLAVGALALAAPAALAGAAVAVAC